MKKYRRLTDIVATFLTAAALSCGSSGNYSPSDSGKNDGSSSVDANPSGGSTGPVNRDSGITNRPPIVNFLPRNMTEIAVKAGDNITLNADAIDPDGDSLKFRFTIEDIYNSGWINETSINTTIENPGAYRTTVIADDEKGGTGEDSIMLMVDRKEALDGGSHETDDGGVLIENNNPYVNFNSSSLETIVGRSNLFNPIYGDPDGDATEISFDFGDGNTTNWTSAIEIEHTYNNEGEYTLTAYVKDNKGGSNLDSVSVLVSREVNDGGFSDGGTPDASTDDGGVIVENHAPSVSFTLDELVTVVARDEIYSFNGSDEDGDSLEYSVDWNDSTITEYSPENRIIHAYTSPGNFTPTVYTRDGKGGVNSDTMNVIVNEETPSLYVDAGPDMTLDLDKVYCFNWGCENNDLEFMCGNDRNLVPFAPGHSNEGFEYIGNISEWKITHNYKGEITESWRLGNACSIKMYRSLTYSQGDKPITRIEVKDNEDNIAYNEFTVTLK